MGTKLLKLIIILTFGRGSGRPVQAAITRIGASFVVSAGLGSAIARSIAGYDLPEGLPLLWIVSVIAWASFTLGAFVLLAFAGMSRESGQQSSTVDRMLSSLPIPRPARWQAHILPPAVLVAIVCIFCLPITVVVMYGLGLPIFAGVSALFFGLLSGSGYALTRWPSQAAPKGALFVLIAAGIAALLSKSIQTHTSVLTTGILTFLALPYLGLLDDYRQVGKLTKPSLAGKTIPLVPVRSLYASWFFVKILRNPRTLGSWAFCVVISSVTALTIWIKHVPLGNDGGWQLFSTILICAFACDIRGLFARYKAIEIHLNGVKYYMLAAFAAVWVLALPICLPIFILTAHATDTLAYIALFQIALLSFGVAVGMLASTLFVPRAGDIGGQFFAAMLAVTILLTLPRLFRFSSLTQPGQIAAWTLAGILCVLIMYSIEEIRRRNYGGA